MKKTKVVIDDLVDIVQFLGKDRLLSNFQNKTVLITGASGMIGSYFLLVLDYLNKEYRANIHIVALVRNKRKISSFLRKNKNLEVIEQDVTNPIHYDDDIHFIIHAASPASPKIMAMHPVETNFANTIGTANTLLLAQNKKVISYLFLSSREVYGEPDDQNEIFKESSKLGYVNPLIPRNGYAEGKKAAENMCVGFHEEYGLNVKIARLAHTYGPGMSLDDGRVQADFLNHVVHGEDIILKSDGTSIRTYTYIADAIKALFLILSSPPLEEHMVYNIADENSKVSIRELAERIISVVPEKKLSLKFQIENQMSGTSNFKNGILSSAKIRENLNWHPRYGIEEGFLRTIKHLEEENKLS